jgi:hypothetical protein
MLGQDFSGENRLADRAPQGPLFLLNPPQKSRGMIRLLGSGLILFAGFLAFSSCSLDSRPLTLKGDLVRLLDVFPQFIIAQTPPALTSTVDISKDKVPGPAEEEFCV